MKKIHVIGHSQMTALRRAKTVDETFEFHNLHDPVGRSSWREIDGNNCTSVVLLIGGNYHNAVGLLNHPVLFDFYLPEKVNLPITPNAKLLPVGLVLKVLGRGMAPAPQFHLMFTLVEFLRKKNIDSFYQIQSPPPVPSETHIRKYLDKVFKDKINQLGVSPPEFRYKLWRLCSKLVREECEKLGVAFIEAPKNSQDSEGFLCEKYWNLDATHANPHYGDLVLNQIRTIHNMDVKQVLI